MLTVEPERAAKVQHQQPEPLDKRLILDAAEQLAYSGGIAHNASLDPLRQPRAARDTAPPPPAVDTVFAGHVNRFVMIRYFHPQ